MSTNSQDQEIDLGQVFKKLGSIFQSFLDLIFDLILFIKRNIIVLVILFIVGAGLGYYLDKSDKAYNHSIIVTPNFGSNDYLYSKIGLLNAKIKEDDTIFLSAVGLKKADNLKEIEIKPVVDVYKFINNKPENFDLIKLMAEDGDIKEIIENDITSKNYPFHMISFKTKDKTTNEITVNPILSYLNNSEYFDAIKKQQIENIKVKMVANDSTITQINSLLNDFSKTSSTNQKSDKLVYYNENNQLNEIIKTKDLLITEQGNNRIQLINSDQIIKEISSSINKKNTKGLHNKMKLLIPFTLIFLFFLFVGLNNLYKAQINKRK